MTNRSDKYEGERRRVIFCSRKLKPARYPNLTNSKADYRVYVDFVIKLRG